MDYFSELVETHLNLYFSIVKMNLDLVVIPVVSTALVASNMISYKLNRTSIHDPIHEMFGVESRAAIYCKDVMTFLPMGLLTSYDFHVSLVAFRIYIMASVFRPICFLSTCIPCPNNRTRGVKTAVDVLNGSRGDLIYSGHTTFLFSTAMTIYEFYSLHPFDVLYVPRP